MPLKNDFSNNFTTKDGKNHTEYYKFIGKIIF